MQFSSHIFFVIVLCLSSWLLNLNKILILDFQKLWVTFVLNKCPHPKQVAPCQDLEKCAEVGVGVGGMGCHTLLNSPSSLRGASLMDYEYWHHSFFSPPPPWQLARCHWNLIIHSTTTFPRQLDLGLNQTICNSPRSAKKCKCSVLWFLEGRRCEAGCVTTIIRMSGKTHQR